MAHFGNRFVSVCMRNSTPTLGLVCTTMLIFAAPAVFGQAAAPPAFEVATIKPTHAGDNRTSLQITPGGRFNANNVSLKLLMQQAYQIKDFQITGGPGWIASEKFDISAKADDSAGQSRPGADQIRPMLQALLAERFKLTFHRETKEMPVYALVVAKNGPKIHASEGGSGTEPGEPGGRPGPGGPRGMMRMNRGQLSGQHVGMDMLVAQLSNAVGRSVLDRTGLKGSFDFKLEWTPEEMPKGLGEGAPTGETTSAGDSTGPSIFTAVQEQLGLKLEPERGPVEIFVIDRVEKPSEN